MHPITKEKLGINLRNSWRMASNWVMSVSGVGFAVYLGLPPEQQAALLLHMPIPPWIVPIAVSGVGIGARVWPQHAISPAAAAAKSEDAPQPPAAS